MEQTETNTVDSKLFLMRFLYRALLPFGAAAIASLIAYLATRHDSNFEGARGYGFIILLAFWWLVLTLGGLVSYIFLRKHVKPLQLMTIILAISTVGLIWSFS